MTLNIIDVVIILFLLAGAILGFKRGAVRTAVNLVGVCFTAVVAFVFKDKLMVLLCSSLPFFRFTGIISGLSVFNVLLYQAISFIVIFLALYFILKVLLVVTRFVELLLKLTVFLEVPSKIFGVVFGTVEYYLYAFLILFIASFPIFNIEMLSDSVLANQILDSTPIVSKYASDTLDTYTKVYYVLKDRKKKTNEEINAEVLIILLDNKLITVDAAKDLIDRNKIEVNDKTIVDNYKNSEIYDYLNKNIYEKVTK